jgi:hypothetical protein
VETETVDSYDDALARAMTLAPMFRSERTICESFAPVESHPLLPASARVFARAVVVATATTLALLLLPSLSAFAVVLAAAFGLAAAATGDRVGATLRGILVRTGWPERAKLAATAAVDVTVVAILTISVALFTGTDLAGLAFTALVVIATAVGFASRIGDAEIEARAAAREAARNRRETTEHAVRGAINALRMAHAANLTQIAAEMGHPQILGDDDATFGTVDAHPGMSVGA